MNDNKCESTKYILAHDMGTSSDKAVLVDFGGNIIATAVEPYPTYYPEPAWVEQDPEDYYQAVAGASRAIIEKTGIDPSSVKGIVFSTQAQGVIPVDKEGKPLYNNITWVDGRAEKQAQSIMKKLGGKRVFTMVAGTPIMGKDCIAKIIWLKEERRDIYKKTYKILDVNGYLKFRLTGRMVTELSGASSYGLDLKKKEWLGVMKLTGIDMRKLPPLVKSTDIVGGLTADAAAAMGLNEGTPVLGGCDDVQAAAVGSGMVGDGDVHIYLGTSAWAAAASRTHDKFMHGAAAIQSADPEMNLIAGITESAGANIQWLQEQFFAREKEEYGDGIFAYMDDVIKKIPPGSDHLICTPWMLGERCPVSTTTTRATLFNISMVHTREHLMRAVYEGIGYNLRWILENYQADYGFNCDNFRIIGGGALDDAWMQIIADITGKSFDVVRDPRNAGAVGAAIVAMIGLGELPDFSAAKDFVRIERSYSPDPANRAIYDELFDSYKDVYNSLKDAYVKANGRRFKGEE
ncbi:MAG: FGGY-family carbohydrate kinase [Firmicutes bacterium]|nr:FGGY-family carbohydrate kinase [Bacillota bacterium]